MPAAKKTKREVKAVSPWKPLSLFDHQQKVEDAYKAGLRRFFLGWHRRAGKDVFALDFARKRMQERVGTYWHLFPFHIQAKRAIWKGIDARTGQRFIDRAFPKHLRHSENDTEMSITFKDAQGEPAATWQMLGSDNYDRMVGSNPCGIIFSEWALCDPAAWDYIRPILIENKGWAMFITTFRGRNHAWRMFESVKELESWYAEIRTIEQTFRSNGVHIIDPADVDKVVAEEKMKSELVQQEFYCNPDAASVGALFSKQYNRLLDLDTRQAAPNNKILRIAWGCHEEGIAAVAFQGSHIIGVHTFLESNLTDAVQAVARRHPHTVNVHHAMDPDPQLFGVLDGSGIVASPLGASAHTQHGHVGAMLNTCSATSIARETLADFAMSYAPYREANSDEDGHLVRDALMKAIAVMHTAQPYSGAEKRKSLNYSAYDKGVI